MLWEILITDASHYKNLPIPLNGHTISTGPPPRFLSPLSLLPLGKATRALLGSPALALPSRGRPPRPHPHPRPRSPPVCLRGAPLSCSAPGPLRSGSSRAALHPAIVPLEVTPSWDLTARQPELLNLPTFLHPHCRPHCFWLQPLHWVPKRTLSPGPERTKRLQVCGGRRPVLLGHT